MNILLAGGAGYIGSHTAVVLSEAGHEVVLFDNFCNSSKSVLIGLEKILQKSIVHVEGDIRDTSLVAKTLLNYKIDAVIHLAGLKAVGESNEKPLEYYVNNVQGSISLVQAMQSSAVKVLIFSSSATVYGAPQYLPIDECHPTKPTNPYGRTKLHIEEMLKDVAISDSSMKIVCFRYFNPVGAHSSGLIREEPNGVPNNLMPFICQVANKKFSKLNIYGNDYHTKDGTGVRDYIHVMDLAEVHLTVLSFLEKISGFEIFNIGTGEGVSVLELIKNFERSTGIPIPYEFKARRRGDVPVSFTLVDKVKDYFCWSASRDLTEMTTSSWLGIQNGNKVDIFN
jgi:UDP-glucose 4-epimerase